jgi:hypothetical protein
MCAFCATIPAAVAVGVRAEAGQRRKRAARAESGSRTRPQVPFLPLTVLLVGGLVLASTLYHSRQFG